MFEMTEEEKSQIEEVRMFILIFYVKPWFQSPLTTSAARNDLTFMKKIIGYKREVNQGVGLVVTESCHRHLWYLLPETVALALVDPGLGYAEKEKMALNLQKMEKPKTVTRKPEFPSLLFSGDRVLDIDLASLISPRSWLLFELAGISEDCDWLGIPAIFWEKFESFRKFRDFATNLPVVNDIAERGISLVSNFINNAMSEEQRQNLFQVVEYHRNMVTNTNKESLKKC